MDTTGGISRRAAIGDRPSASGEASAQTDSGAFPATMVETPCAHISAINTKARQVMLRGGSGRTITTAARSALRLRALRVRDALAVSIEPARDLLKWLYTPLERKPCGAGRKF